MIFAKINESKVVNMIELRQAQASEFPDCVDVNGLPVGIGDEYIDGKFYRDGKLVKTDFQKAQDQMVIISEAAIASVAETCAQINIEPKANVGLFIMGAEDWEPNKAYNRFDLIRYNGSIAWVKQAHTSQETWLPFSVGTESLYGARPCPDEDGVYPYVYNMKVDLGMKVSHEGIVYECIQATDDLLYAPAQVPALFKVVE